MGDDKPKAHTYNWAETWASTLRERDELRQRVKDLEQVANTQAAHLAATRETADAKHGIACREARRQRDELRALVAELDEAIAHIDTMTEPPASKSPFVSGWAAKAIRAAIERHRSRQMRGDEEAG